jgi:hypothetical protein
VYFCLPACLVCMLHVCMLVCMSFILLAWFLCVCPPACLSVFSLPVCFKFCCLPGGAELCVFDSFFISQNKKWQSYSRDKDYIIASVDGLINKRIDLERLAALRRYQGKEGGQGQSQEIHCLFFIYEKYLLLYFLVLQKLNMSPHARFEPSIYRCVRNGSVV